MTENVPTPGDAGNRPPWWSDDAEQLLCVSRLDVERSGPLLVVVACCLATLDDRIAAEALLAGSADLDVGALVEVERMTDNIAALSRGAVALLQPCMPSPDYGAAVGADEAMTAGAALDVARTSARVRAIAASPHWRDPGEPAPRPLTDAERLVVAMARQAAAELAPLQRRHTAHLPRLAEGADRPARAAWLRGVERAADLMGYEEVRATYALLGVALTAGMAPTLPPGTALRGLLPAMRAKLCGFDGGDTYVRRALVLLGHRPDDFKGATRANRSRAKALESLVWLREHAPQRLREKVRPVVARHGGVNKGAANELGINKGQLDDLIAGDPALDSELRAANTAAPRPATDIAPAKPLPARRRPKAG